MDVFLVLHDVLLDVDALLLVTIDGVRRRVARRLLREALQRQLAVAEIDLVEARASQQNRAAHALVDDTTVDASRAQRDDSAIVLVFVDVVSFAIREEERIRRRR